MVSFAYSLSTSLLLFAGAPPIESFNVQHVPLASRRTSIEANKSSIVPRAHPVFSLVSARKMSALEGSNNEDEFDFEGFQRQQQGGLIPETSFGAENVPEGQRPANEYLDLIRQPLFGWASEESGTKGLAVRLAIVYAVFFAAVCYPIAGATFTQDGYLLQKLAASNVGALLMVLFVLVRLYSGWGYVGSRLKSKVIEFEETGWYDGDFEEKSEAEKARDLFLYRSNVKPVEERLKLFSIVAGSFWVASCVGMNVAFSSKPLFNEYDPALLERLAYDEKLAGVAAKQSNGRPTYCDSRFYRAVANGGQGCK